MNIDIDFIDIPALESIAQMITKLHVEANWSAKPATAHRFRCIDKRSDELVNAAIEQTRKRKK
jgi:hypothetical protein